MKSPQRTDFRYDPTNDLVVATPRWKIESEADVTAWYQQYVTYFARYNRRIDVVFVLDNFHIVPAMGPLWGEYRAKLHQQFTRHSYRVHPDRWVQMFSNTSGVRFDVATQEAPTVEDAIQGILAARRGAGS